MTNELRAPLITQISFNDTPSVSIPFSKLGLTLKGFDYFIEQCGGRDNLIGLTVTDVNIRYQLNLTLSSGLSYCEYLLNEGKGDDYVKKGTVFISHAWKYQFLDTYDTLKDYFSNRSDVVLWFDLFSNNQHKAVELDFSWWTGTFMEAIEAFGETVMVLTPWENPWPLKRAWCLYEIYSTVIAKGKFSIALSKKEEQAFLIAIKKHPDVINKMLATIHIEYSEAFKLSDKENIIQTVKSTCGFNDLNTIVFTEIRKWVIQTVENQLKRLDVLPEEILCLKTILGDILRQQGFLDKAEKIYLSCLKEWNNLKGIKNEYSFGIMNRLGDLYYRKANGAESLKYYMACFDEGYAIDTSISNETAISEIDYMNKIMDIITSCPCCYSLKYRTPKLEPKLSSDSSIKEIRSYYMLASLYYKQARRKKAEPMFIDSIHRLKNLVGENSEEILVMKSNLAALYFYENDYEKSEKLLLEVYDNMKNQLTEDHPYTLLVLQNLAYYYLDRKQFDKAITLYELLVDKVISKQGQHVQGVRKIMLNYAISLYGNHQYLKSLKVLKEASNLAYYDVMVLLLNNSNTTECSCQCLCISSCFACLQNSFSICIPCHYISSKFCCYNFNHVENIVATNLLSTLSCCLCFSPIVCLQSCILQQQQ